MRRIIPTALLVMFMSMGVVHMYAYDAKIDGIYYNFYGNTATVTNSYSDDYWEFGNILDFYSNDYFGNVVIPESVTYESKNYNVTQIGYKAFCVCKSLVSVSIPNSVTNIANYAFYGCTNLASVTIPNSVNRINEGVFDACYRLTVTIPKSVKTIEKYAFEGVAIQISDLTAWMNIDFTNYYWTSSSHRLYLNGQEITDLIIPQGRTDIDLAFMNCSSLISVTIPEGFVSIGKKRFYGCSNLKTIVLPSTLEKIGDYAFDNCDAIETIYSNITRVFSLPTDNPPFEQIVYDNAILYVPVGTKTKYQQIQGWKKFLNIRENSVDITISTAGYSTFYNSQFAYILPNGLSAQVVTNASNGKLTYKTIADGNTAGIVPKGTAVILASQGGRVGIYTLNPTLNDASYSGTNLLHGSDNATTTTGNGYHYKLSYGKTGTEWNDVFGWYWGAQDGTPFQIEGHKAWLVVPNGGTRAEGFTIDGDATEIISIVSEEEGLDVYYDIQGRRISTPARSGLYIKNGKKIVIK